MPFVAPWQSVTPEDFTRAAEAGAQLGLSVRSEGEQERAARAREALESARMQQAASEAAANRGLQTQELEQRGKQTAEQLAYDRAQQEKVNALNLFKAQQPDVITPRGGGIFTRNPLTGDFTKNIAPPPATPRAQPETMMDRLNLERYRALASARDKAITAKDQASAKAYGDQMDQLANSVQNPNAPAPPKQIPPFTDDTYKHSFGLFGGKVSPVNPMNAPAAATAQPTMPKAGDVQAGYKFTGGDPADQNNWQAQ